MNPRQLDVSEHESPAKDPPGPPFYFWFNFRSSRVGAGIPTATARCCACYPPAAASFLPVCSFPSTVLAPYARGLFFILHSTLGTHRTYNPTICNAGNLPSGFLHVPLLRRIREMRVSASVSGIVSLSYIVCVRFFVGIIIHSWLGRLGYHILATKIHQVCYSSLTP